MVKFSKKKPFPARARVAPARARQGTARARLGFISNFQKIEKKVVRRFLTYLSFFDPFEFFTKSVLQTLLKGRETTKKKYRELSEKATKNIIFSNFQKIDKKVVRRLLTYLNFFNFFKFFTKSVLQTLLRGRETTR